MSPLTAGNGEKICVVTENTQSRFQEAVVKASEEILAVLEASNQQTVDDVKELEMDIAKYKVELTGEVQENSNN